MLHTVPTAEVTKILLMQRTTIEEYADIIEHHLGTSLAERSDADNNSKITKTMSVNMHITIIMDKESITVKASQSN